ncbi:MAG: FHA domain-containing protein [Comamonadaceae bacterium]|jgi:pSer/pThr/pTyr-binding forkhead associated (FHA) protein|uniref:FHA domain-containing protein n=1 Tax=Hydrogenophaga sp. SNF1 TaxID=3098762 RepID=UPI002ACBDDFA|nr:FHA domain-containing protein [Hydrogenophaga sp. SNF1]NCT99037.1 FHA domain-containing protein [Comamonadaceae bacterium]WQB83671.1 FHA domain-containing protein [Hydrogenophaga sp. SNF1]
MPKMIVSIDGVVIKEVQLTKDRTTLGRRPYNDIVIDNLAVSGEHAVLQMSGADVFLEDLNSTNGTYVNGKAIKKQQLQGGDTVEIGKYKIKFVNDGAESQEKTTVINAGTVVSGAESASAALGPAAIKVVSGSAAGREVALTKVVTTIGKPGVAVAAITRRPHGYVVAMVEGTVKPTVNGKPLGTDGIDLHNGDLLELAGTQMQFVQP